MKENEIKKSGEHDTSQDITSKTAPIHQKQKENHQVLWHLVELSILTQVLVVLLWFVSNYLVSLWYQSTSDFITWGQYVIVEIIKSFFIFTTGKLFFISVFNSIRVILLIATVSLYIKEKRDLRK